jgi:hypothetical protein
MMKKKPSHPAGGNAGFTLRFAFEHHRLGVPQPVRSAD